VNSVAVVGAGLLGAGVGMGLRLCMVGVIRPADGSQATQPRLNRATFRAVVSSRLAEVDLRRAGAAVAAAVVVTVVTGWIVGGVLAALAVWVVPALVGPDRRQVAALARIEAVASWTEMLRDTLSAAAGLEQTILTTAPLAPAPIRAEVESAAARIAGGQRLAPALRQLAVDIADPVGDLVIAALVLAVEQQARQLGELLGSLARSARAQAAMRMRVEAGRARTRTSVRVVVGTTVAFAAAIVVLNRRYLEVYDDINGQLVLLGIACLFVGGFVWLSRIAAVPDPRRILRTSEMAAPGSMPSTSSSAGGADGWR
jgi:Flp pilus assembly protein TadB